MTSIDHEGEPAAKRACISNPIQPKAITPAEISTVLKKASGDGFLPSTENCGSLFDKPAGLFYDLDAWEGGLSSCKQAFGNGFLNAIAVKSNPLAPMLKKALEMGFGAECASICEVLHAQAIGFPVSRIVYDGPCKTRAEIAWALRNGVMMNIDNFVELDRVAELRSKIPEVPGTVIGLRINPLVGAGAIEALSVSTGDSKFGISSTHCVDKIIAAYESHKWLNGMHVHTGSGGMALQTLVGGVRVAMNLALRVNKALGRRQITVLDIGGGLPANHLSDSWHTDKVPTFSEYSAALHAELPDLFPREGSPFDKIITEFGQALNAKSGFLASRVEYAKPTADGDGQIAVVHFGADVCPRQCYTDQHTRRIELYDGTTSQPKEGAHTRQHIAGPLCFQGDMLVKNLHAPKLTTDDFVVMRDTGANCLSLFSRHCSRQAPRVLGYRVSELGHITELKQLKQVESVASTMDFWGGCIPKELAHELHAQGSTL